MGARLEVPFRRADTADGCGFDAQRADSNGAAFGDASQQPPRRSLFAQHWADRVFGKTPHDQGYGKMGFAERPARPIETICRRRRGRKKISALNGWDAILTLNTPLKQMFACTSQSC